MDSRLRGNDGLGAATSFEEEELRRRSTGGPREQPCCGLLSLKRPSSPSNWEGWCVLWQAKPAKDTRDGCGMRMRSPRGAGYTVRLRTGTDRPYGSGLDRWWEVVPRRGFDPLISTLKGWRPNLARRPGHNALMVLHSGSLCRQRPHSSFFRLASASSTSRPLASMVAMSSCGVRVSTGAERLGLTAFRS